MGDILDVAAQQADARERANRYLALADRILPGWITGFYLVGSAALGEYMPGRSDVDFIATVSAPLPPSGLLRLRRLHLAAGLSALRRSGRGGTPNGAFILESEVGLPVSEIEPVASHVGHRFHARKAFDVNPVMWQVLATRGLQVRGLGIDALGLDPEPHTLTQWNLDNLNSYWAYFGRLAASGRWRRTLSGLRYGGGWAVGWGVLGAPRLHCTIATGEVIGKHGAADYSLATFDEQWHSIIELARAWWLQELPRPVTNADVRLAGQFVLATIASANELARTHGQSGG